MQLLRRGADGDRPGSGKQKTATGQTGERGRAKVDDDREEVGYRGCGERGQKHIEG